MSKKRRTVILTEAQKMEWSQSVVDYLGSLLPNRPLPGPFGPALLEKGILKPHFKLKGYLLLQPGMLMQEAHYLRKGLVKLYCIDPVTGEHKLAYIWVEGSIVVLLNAFREKLANEVYYIELIEDCELVSITSFSMDDIYEKYAVAHELTQKILGLKWERKLLQTDILLMVDKKMRYCVFKRSFPELFVAGKCRLNNNETCSFIGITVSTLTEARKLCPDGPD